MLLYGARQVFLSFLSIYSQPPQGACGAGLSFKGWDVNSAWTFEEAELRKTNPSLEDQHVEGPYAQAHPNSLMPLETLLAIAAGTFHPLFSSESSSSLRKTHAACQNEKWIYRQNVR